MEDDDVLMLNDGVDPSAVKQYSREEFIAHGCMVKFYSRLINDTFWVVARENQRVRTNATCFTIDEIEKIMDLPAEDKKKIFLIKKMFNATIVDESVDKKQNK